MVRVVACDQATPLNPKATDEPMAKASALRWKIVLPRVALQTVCFMCDVLPKYEMCTARPLARSPQAEHMTAPQCVRRSITSDAVYAVPQQRLGTVTPT